MRDLGCHGTNHSEAFRVEVCLFQPLSFFHLSSERGSSLLDYLLEVIVIILERSQQPDDDQEECKKHDPIPNRNERRRICCAIEHIAEKPRARAQSTYNESGPPAGSPCCDARGKQVEGRYCPL